MIILEHPHLLLNLSLTASFTRLFERVCSTAYKNENLGAFHSEVIIPFLLTVIKYAFVVQPTYSLGLVVVTELHYI